MTPLPSPFAYRGWGCLREPDLHEHTELQEAKMIDLGPLGVEVGVPAACTGHNERTLHRRTCYATRTFRGSC